MRDNLRKQVVARNYLSAVANDAKRFLDAVRADLPHDGGAKCRADFKKACG